MSERLIALKPALQMCGGISDSTRRRIEDFPKPIVLARTKSGRPCRICFIEEEILAWCAKRIRESRNESKTVRIDLEVDDHGNAALLNDLGKEKR
jgi:predicted DNA-binding transcriptional regulator AlpA